MDDPLKVYLHDHLAGSRVAIDLLGSLRDQHRGEPLGHFAGELLGEIRQDQQVLKNILGRIGAPRRHWLKDVLAWVGEKLTRFKFHRQTGQGLGTLQRLETLSLGVLGKLALWESLGVIADGRIGEVNLEGLRARARDQHARVEQRRLDAARACLPPRS